MEAKADHELLSLLDAYSGFKQILMYPPDDLNTTFITPYGMYCYMVMSFGLKNVRATYQPMLSRVFEPLLGRTVEAYIDYILVKSKSRNDHLAHLWEAFCFLRRHRLWLNPAKCVFAISSGNFLGFLVSQRGIEIAPGQI